MAKMSAHGTATESESEAKDGSVTMSHVRRKSDMIEAGVSCARDPDEPEMEHVRGLRPVGRVLGHPSAEPPSSGIRWTWLKRYCQTVSPSSFR